MAADRRSSEATRAAALLAALIFLVFGLALRAPFLYDDLDCLVRNPGVVGAWPGWKSWLLTPLLPGLGEHEPLVTLLNRTVYALFGASVPAFRSVSLLLHLACAAAFWTYARRRLSASAALAAAALFALFPAHAEVLAVAAFKKHQLVFLATMGALLLPLGAPAFFGAGLLAKESAYALPLFLWLEGKRRGFALLGAVGAAYAALRFYFVPRVVSLAAFDPLTSVKCLLWYLGQLALPLGLCPEHSLARGGPLVLLGLAPIALFFARVKDKTLRDAAWFILAALLPFLNLFPFLNLSLVSDRYLYLASAGWAMLLGRLLDLGGAGKRGCFLAAALVCLPYSFLATRRLAQYADPLALWRQAAVCAPGHPRVLIAWARAASERGLYEEADAAATRLGEVPGYAAAADVQKAGILLDQKRFDEAAALALSPASAATAPVESRLVAVSALIRGGQCAQAGTVLEEARALDGERAGHFDVALTNCKQSGLIPLLKSKR